MEKRGQTWSVELIISLSIFIVVIIGVFASLSSRPSNSVEDLQQQSQQFIRKFYSNEQSTRTSYSFIENNQINNEKLGQLSTKSYSALKSELGLSDDFCIFLLDSNDKIIPIQGNDGHTYYGIGSNSIQLGENVQCNATIT